MTSRTKTEGLFIPRATSIIAQRWWCGRERRAKREGQGRGALRIEACAGGTSEIITRKVSRPTDTWNEKRVTMMDPERAPRIQGQQERGGRIGGGDDDVDPRNEARHGTRRGREVGSGKGGAWECKREKGEGGEVYVMPDGAAWSDHAKPKAVINLGSSTWKCSTIGKCFFDSDISDIPALWNMFAPTLALPSHLLHARS